MLLVFHQRRALATISRFERGAFELGQASKIYRIGDKPELSLGHDIHLPQNNF
jgi:hypothetical protein